MVDYEAISVIIFKMKNNQPYFYLVKRSSGLPIFPDTWTPIAGATNQNDKNVYSYLYDKVGNIIDDMASRLTAVRLLIERNLLNPFEEDQKSKSDLDVYKRMEQIDQDVLSVYLHSMIPAGFHKVDDGHNTFNVKHFIFISTGISFFNRIKLIKKSTIYTNPQCIIETRSKWFSVKQIKSSYHKPTMLFNPSFIYLINLITDERMKLIEAARKIEEELATNETIDYQILPNIWRFVTPASYLPPFHTTNIYVIGDKTKYIIDPGSNGTSDLVNLINFVEAHLDHIEGIILTNANKDHCNQVVFLKNKYNFPIYSSKYVADIMKKEDFVVNHILQEGEKIPMGPYIHSKPKDWNLEVISLPGNSQGCIGLLDSRGIIFTGSTLHKTLTTTPGPYPNSLSDLYNSISKLKKYPAKYGLSGHGKIIPNVKEAISINLRRLRWGEKSILINLKKGFSSVDDIENELIRDDNPNWQRITRNTIIANLELLIDQGKVIRRGDDYLIKNNNHTDFPH